MKIQKKKSKKCQKQAWALKRPNQSYNVKTWRALQYVKHNEMFFPSYCTNRPQLFIDINFCADSVVNKPKRVLLQEDNNWKF